MSGDGRPRRIPVPRAVYDGIEAVRRSGLTNMFDRPRVAELAEEMGFDKAAAWVRQDRARYAAAVFRGILEDKMPEPEPDPVAASHEPTIAAACASRPAFRSGEAMKETADPAIIRDESHPSDGVPLSRGPRHLPDPHRRGL